METITSEAQQLFIEATTSISEYEALGGNEGFIARFNAECIQGSAISLEMLSLNIRYVEDKGRWEINDWLEQNTVRFGKIEKNWNYRSAAFFVSENGRIFNAKVANPKESYKKLGGFGQEEWISTGKKRKYEAVQGGGNRIFYPALDRATREKISRIYRVELPLDGDIWPWLLQHSEIPIGITEGAKKALSLCCQGFPCISVLGIANWSIPKAKHPETGLTDPNQARVLLPELAELAKDGRTIPIWYDQDDPKTKLKAFISAKREGQLLANALKAAGANEKTSLLWWPSHMGKGIDDVIVRLLNQGTDIPQWIEETIAGSKNAATYDQIKRLYAIAEGREIESATSGGYISDHLELKLESGKIHALVAGTGAGKTSLVIRSIEEWIAAGGFAVALTTTNKLGKQLADLAGLPHRHDYACSKLLSLKADDDGGFVSCLDSLLRLKDTIPANAPLLVFCEEADQLANHATTGQTLKGKYSPIQEALSALLSRAEVVILAEARIPENTLKYFEQISGKSTRVFTHELAIQKRNVTCYGGQISGFEAMILQRLREGEKLIVTADSQRELEAIERLIQQELPQLKGLRNDQKNSYLPGINELTVRPNQVLAREQLDYLLYSPSCKAGWDLSGKDERGYAHYKFDRVMGIFRVLPTSDQIQMIARYRPDCPWEIFLSETILVSGNEAKGSPRAISRDMEAEAQRIAQGWGIPYEPSERPPLEKIARDHYVIATARAGLEKRINRYSTVQRLIEDGHNVSEQQLAHNKAIADRMKAIKIQIDRDWADLLASVKLSLTDDLELAKQLEKLEAPTPEQRAKAEKIRLSNRFGGVDFDNSEICYQATCKFKALPKGVELEAAARNIQIAASVQKQATIEHFNQPILAIHHLPHDADRAGLLITSGIMEMLSGDLVFTSTSSSVLDLKEKILAKADEWSRYFGFNFTADQSPISFLTRAAKRLGFKFQRSRPGGLDRPYQYRVYTPDAIEEQIQKTRERAEQLRLSQIEKSENISALGQLATDRDVSLQAIAGQLQAGLSSIELFERQERLLMEAIEATGRTMDESDKLAIKIAALDEKIAQLLDVRSQIEVRSSLLQAALARYSAMTSTLSIDNSLINKSVDRSSPKEIIPIKPLPNLEAG